MRRFIPAGFETRNGVLIALLGLCLRSRHIAEGRRTVSTIASVLEGERSSHHFILTVFQPG